MKLLMGSSLPQINLTISTDQTSYNIKSQAGNPTVASLIIVTVNSGIRIAHIKSGALVTGTKIRIINNGCIFGDGGPGGNGGNSQATVINPGSVGGAGGIAIEMEVSSLALEIDNTNGYILGGGAGGKGGDSAWHPLGDAAGGGGGGGAGGGVFGDAGTGGSGTPFAQNGSSSHLPHWNVSYWDDGFPGGSNEIGLGGAGGHDFYVDGAAGANGGAYGTSGKAVHLNGNPITWLGGNNSTQVKGAVS